ncbi:hypothetical protein D9613_001133 [Agrocybe pediades]|uniref:F-box domain-containing protein n=1 Tax=Agrocybe pediades TaxID=84607 RepID=A0A8H4VST1_9AGAR|nr:hypothetical protein D9613_001133 [Agrocybe pediades]
MLGEGPCVPSTSHLPSPPPNTRQEKEKEEVMGLSTLPYDLLLNIATYLDLRDVHALHLTCSSLYDASTTRPVYRKLANDLLRRCRALPLKGFQRLSDLTTDKLIKAVNKATHYENAWRTRAPRPIAVEPYKNGISCHSNYMDVAPGGPLALQTEREGQKWYKIVSAPPDEEVDWLSPITSSYTLCATKSGKVVCWDVQTDTCLAEWNPGARWELWKCRVEFEERTVYFTMAKVLTGSYDDDRVMEFVLMRLTFSDGPSGESSRTPPIFSHVTEFRTTGVVMNVFLLDPSIRLLSAFIWVSTSNTIGLYALPDWNNKEYVFIDTGIECVMSSNWSCILYQQNIVIHCEESDAAYQHFYPLSLLRSYTATLDDTSATPVICGRVAPARTLKKKFIFPLIPSHDTDDDHDNLAESDADSEQDAGGPSSSSAPQNGGSSVTQTSLAPHNHSSYIDILLSMVPPSSQETSLSTTSSSSSTTLSSSSGPSSSSSSSSMVVSATLPPNPNPYPFPPWYPESAHFVRQWWPSLPNIPRVSCTVVLLAAHDQNTHRTRFVLAQHYFRVPLDHAEWENDPIQAGSSSPGSNQKEKQPESSHGGQVTVN